MKTDRNALKLKKGGLLLMGILLIQCGKSNTNQDTVLFDLPTSEEASQNNNEIRFRRKETFIINSATGLLQHRSNRPPY